MADENYAYKIGIPYSQLNKHSADVIVYKLNHLLNDKDAYVRKWVESFINSQHFQFFLRTTDFFKFMKIANFLDGVEDARKAISRS